jgi:predicted metal-dependent peptidase
MSNDITSAMMHLIRTDRFFAEILMAMDRRIDDKIPHGAAGVTIKPRPTLHYHSGIFANNTVQAGADLLKHESLHLLFNHIVRGGAGGKMSHQVKNIAMDLAVNSFINGFQEINILKDGEWVPSKLCTVANYKKDMPELKLGQTYEWYMSVLKKYMPELEQKGCSEGGNGQVDDHSQWTDAQGSEYDVNQVKGIVQGAYERATGAGWQPNDQLRDLVKKLLSTENPWKRELQRFPQDAEVAWREGTWRRRNRRTPGWQPGERKERKVKIHAGFDTSGSVGGPLISAFFAELQKMEDAGADVMVHFFDHQVQGSYSLDDAKKLKQVPGGGGTNFQPVLDKVRELKGDGLVMITDGMNGDQISKPNFPVLWAVPTQFKYEAPFGKVVSIEVGET